MSATDRPYMELPPAGPGGPHGADGSAEARGEHPTDLLASYVLDVLEPHEQAAVEAHLRSCPSCTAALGELRGALDALPLVASPVTPPSRARDALMARVASSVQQSTERAPAPADRRTVVMPAPDTTSRGGWWGGAGGWAVAGVLAATTAVSAWQWAAARRELGMHEQQAASLRRQVDAIAQMDPQSTRVAPLRGAAPAAGIQGRLVYEANGQNGLAILDHLPPLPAGKVYQLWLLQGSTPVSAGTFRVDPGGTGTLVFQAPGRIGGFTGLGLTQEPEPGVAQPTGAILASGAL